MKHSKPLLVVFVVFFGFLMFVRTSTIQAVGNTYYVSTSGNDANSCSSAQNINTPKRTINNAAGCLAAGDTLYIRGGTYNEVVNIANSGNSSSYVTVSGYPGETVIIDGNNTIPTVWDALIQVTGNYVEVKNLTIQNSLYLGMLLDGDHDIATNVISQLNWDSGITIRGLYDTVQDSQSYYNCRENEFGANTRGFWGAGISTNGRFRGFDQYAIIQRNKIWNNWGEGLSTFENKYSVLQDNIVYDNWLNVYLSDTQFTTLQRNLIYSTPNNIILKYRGVTGIFIGDEVFNPASANNTVINNMVVGNSYNIYSGIPLVNFVIANNTFVNSIPEQYNQGGVIIGSSGHSNSIFANNIILQEDNLPIATVTSNNGLSFSNNLWSKTPPSSASGAGDIIGNPQLAKTGSIAPGSLTGDYFKLLSTSPAINKAKVLSQVTDDFFKTIRGLFPDIGAHEYGGVATTPTPTATPTPTFSKCDQNHDTSINVLDLQSLANVILGKTTCSYTCDLNQDASTNVLDLQYLANVILGKSSCQ